ncbi:MAG: hypothetical protein WA210_08445, partial [Burkholderiaceae bacterium]
MSTTRPSGDGTYVSRSASLSVAGTASDDVGVTQVQWSNNRGGSGSATLGGSATAATWASASVALSPGSNTVTISARDAAGNTGSSSIIVTYLPTYYVDANAADDSGNGSLSRPKKYIGSGAALMSSSGGDTLIVKAGTYSNPLDAIGKLVSGKAGAWNIIRAEVDGTVTITAPLNIPLGDHYLQFEGLKWEGPTEKGINGRFVKMLRCAFKDGPATGNTVVLGIGTSNATPGAQYILVEDSYVYGAGGRYKILVYNSDKVILRRIVARHQDGWSDTKGDPQAVVSLYN